VVLVFFDEFPLQSLLDSGGRIDRRVYPNLAGVADRATWYRNATGVSRFTQWAVPAMLTGRYPSKFKAPIAQQYPDNLFTLFGQSYNLKVDELVTRLCPTQQCPPGGDANPPASRLSWRTRPSCLGRWSRPMTTTWTRPVSPARRPR